MSILAMSRKSTLLVSFLESYLNVIQPWLIEWKIAINVSKSRAIIFDLSGRRFTQKANCNKLRGTNPMGRNHSLSGVTLDKRLTWSPHNDYVRKIHSKNGKIGSPPKEEE
jgi:hypothetical protein